MVLARDLSAVILEGMVALRSALGRQRIRPRGKRPHGARVAIGGIGVLMRFTKHRKKRNRAGTFCFLVTLNIHERCERPRMPVRVELAPRL